MIAIKPTRSLYFLITLAPIHMVEHGVTAGLARDAYLRMCGGFIARKTNVVAVGDQMRDCCLLCGISECRK